MSVDVKVPAIGESVVSVEIGQWLKSEGDTVDQDENLVALESEKATVDLPAPASGRLVKILKAKGDTASVGEIIGRIEENGASPSTSAGGASQPDSQSKPKPSGAGASPGEPAAREESGAEIRVLPAAARLLAEHDLRPEDVEATGPGGRLTKEDVMRHVQPKSKEPTPTEASKPATSREDREEERVPMTLLRRTIAHRLVEAQRQAALLTTFNEIDMTAVTDLRRRFQEPFQERYRIKLGLTSFFVKAVVDALKRVPQINAEIRDEHIVYRNYYDIGVAIGGGRGLVVPVLRNAERLSFAEIEKAVADFALRAKENRLTPDELQGGTFTITNGGVFGSLLSTPIVNPPQSGVLGLHAIQERPVARDAQVVIRPMMYIALTYDHRLVDGREAVTFLKRVKESVEDPARMLMEV